MGGLFEERHLALEEPHPGKVTGARSQPFVKKRMGGLKVDELNVRLIPRKDCNAVRMREQ